MRTIAIAILFLSAALLAGWHRESVLETHIEQAWLDGYRAYQVEKHTPKPNHKAPVPGLKVKVQG